MNDIIQIKDVPNLDDDYEVASVDLNSEYWTPESEGESRRMIFMQITKQTVPDHNDPEVTREVDCAVFIEPGESGNHKTVVSGSARLVAAFDNHGIKSGTPVQVTFKGEKQNRTNSKKSFSWDIRTLAKKGKT